MHSNTLQGGEGGRGGGEEAVNSFPNARAVRASSGRGLLLPRQQQCTWLAQATQHHSSSWKQTSCPTGCLRTKSNKVTVYRQRRREHCTTYKVRQTDRQTDRLSQTDLHVFNCVYGNSCHSHIPHCQGVIRVIAVPGRGGGRGGGEEGRGGEGAGIRSL